MDGDMDDPTAEEIATAKAKAVGLAAAIDVAKATDGTDGTFDDAAHMVAPVVMATNDGDMVTVTVTEEVAGGRSGDFEMQEEGPAAIEGWTGARFTRGTATEHLTVYTDIDAPEPMAFDQENVRMLKGATDVTVTDRVLNLGGSPAAGLLAHAISTSLAAAAKGAMSVNTFLGVDDTFVNTFTGSFGGAMGEYSCTGTDCTVTLNDKGVVTAVGGVWTFKAEAGAMVMLPDSGYLNFGWWMDETANDDGTYSYAFQTFANATDATGMEETGVDVTNAMMGTATYTGAAAGVYVTKDVSGGNITAADMGEFAASAKLEANFLKGAQAGLISGSIYDFMNADGDSMTGWRVTLQPTALILESASFAGATDATIGTGAKGSGSWEGTFYGGEGDEQPTDVAGRFDAHFTGAHVVGAYGASQ